ncbi:MULTISPECIES: ornithine cyclodeaminase family protein [Streptomyces]|uniref:Ornithine cyclodeaminase family protein n=1 Tax=Streptomyces olivaceus TaxID=47716 RepID=A0ABS7W061_STROV|nr:MULTISPECIES: ornithine cyclodeaminase family protein [Streptomyces]MBZ6080565.1 ornithine cyclodeaminase family protein [Streptomyces olivaceus]MBZ6087871.1 ornithine cyclodeaminase family protein [Streptomyces olivaceus]MBZ6095293.1 ornithine cyclodeaminase family protein [Streptomyces olivaceus]MBZ6109364.1 ornithine cyclodeaminase family protein [Streptomyces olivaceus]MBZ6116009.1 ornithine cyclodeaminase family protein [Streptomyces olivaceus]
MLHIDAEQTVAALPFDRLVPALRDGFVRGAHSPDRHHHAVDGGGDATLLLMPAWSEGGFLGVKLVNVFPRNAALGRPALSSAYILASAVTGEHLAVIDGDELTRRRTMATSALAATYLARPDSGVLLVVGAGHVASRTADAYRSVLGIHTVLVHSRSGDSARRLADRLSGQGLDARAVTDLPAAVAEADVVSCATLATEPVVRGEWLRPGTHLDLVGSFRPTMRESDDQCVRRGSVFIDTPQAVRESGDLTQPLESGVLTPDDIRGTLSGLCGGTVPGRRSPEEITVFKSVGSALADLTAAAAVYQACGPSSESTMSQE